MTTIQVHHVTGIEITPAKDLKCGCYYRNMTITTEDGVFELSLYGDDAEKLAMPRRGET